MQYPVCYTLLKVKYGVFHYEVYNNYRFWFNEQSYNTGTTDTAVNTKSFYVTHSSGSRNNLFRMPL